MTLAYGFDVDAPERYGPAVEIALDDLRDAVARGESHLAAERRALLVGATPSEIAVAFAEAGNRA